MPQFLITVPFATMCLTIRKTKAGEFGATFDQQLSSNRTSLRYLVHANDKQAALAKGKEFFDTNTKWMTFTEVPKHIAAERAERARIRKEKS